ncbi:MAG: GNAT family N-acetyltransferase [Deltaproteobacteria bacterium]|jgi:mycothiol synthase|nr:GNAT family N-acetyltransferase [Deltaproteobacteria bacterium]
MHHSDFQDTFQTSDFTNQKKRIRKEIKVEAHPFRDTITEFEEMRSLLVKSYTFNKNFGSWMFSRLENWKFGSNMLKAGKDPDYFKKRAQLWRNEKKELIGFCIQEYENSGIHIQPRPGDLFLIPLMVDWIVSDWGKDKETIETYSIDEDFYTYELLMVAGFKDLGDVGIMREYETSLKREQILLKPGFTVKSLSTYQNYESLIDTINAAFGLKKKLNIDWLSSKFRAPSGSENWQLSIVNSDGECVSFCFVWIDPINKIAEIDPIGTHPDYQQNGFANHLIIECFNRLKLEGIDSCYIPSKPGSNPSNRLYEALIPESVKKYRLWKI